MTDVVEKVLDVKAEVSELDKTLDNTVEVASPTSGEIEAAVVEPEALTSLMEVESAHETVLDDATLKAPMPVGKGTLSIDSKAAREEWKRLGEEVKPDHLRVPACAYELIDRIIQPLRSEEVVRPSCRPCGMLVPRFNFDPSIVRGFIHRLDKNHDDLIEPHEIADLSLKQSLGLTEAQIGNLFQRVIDRRPPGKRNTVGIGWADLAEETRILKKWVTAVDVCVTRQDGESYLVAVEKESLLRWCASVHSQFSAEYPGLEAPTDPDSFLASMLVVSRTTDGKLLQSEPRVQKMLMSQTDDLSSLVTQPHVLATTKIASQRETWGYDSPPYRDVWLRIFHAAGLNPFPKLESCAHGKPLGRPSNVVKANKKCHIGKEGKVQVREPKPKVMQRSGDLGQKDEAKMQLPVQSWDEKRHHSEGLVNTCIKSHVEMSTTERDVLVGAGFGDDLAGGSTSSNVSISFGARRKFLQVQARQDRDSDEQRYIGQTKNALLRQASLLGQAGAAVANIGITHGGPHSHLGFSQHQLTSSITQNQLKYEPNLPHTWDGTHIDHSLEKPLREDVKYSKLRPGEREKQFGFYFKKYDNQSAKVEALEGARHVVGKFEGWKNPEFRADRAQRHGKYGRRVFDAQVNGIPLEPLISGIDNKPTEEFGRQQDLVHEFLDRSLPPNQTKHFETYLPASQKPFRKEMPIATQHLGYGLD